MCLQFYDIEVVVIVRWLLYTGKYNCVSGCYCNVVVVGR